MNDIIKLFNLEDEDIVIEKIEIIDLTKNIYLKKVLKPMFCPNCSSRMYSKGNYTRIINHPILQDGYHLKLILKQRKWRCTNPYCNQYCNEEFSFVEKYNQSTNITPYLVLEAMKNINVTAADVAKRYFISDTQVHTIVLRYLNPKRLPLPRILAVDEVFLDFDSNNRYCLVLFDFINDEIIDVLPNRFKDTIDEYFYSISLEERNNVEFVICDMYNPYVNFTVNYFHKATAIVDSFHVIQWINNKISLYINDIKKKYQAKDREQLDEYNYKNNRDYKTKRDSNEVYILKNYKWVLLKNMDHINYSTIKYKDSFLHMYLDTYEREKMFLELDSHFSKIRDLKELYIQFNSLFPQTSEQALTSLESIIVTYKNSGYSMFIAFADLLIKYKTEIVASFTALPVKVDSTSKETIRRMSNGPIEGSNRFSKDLKRNSRGVSNFTYTRNRLLWSLRSNEPILAIPLPEKKVHTYTNKMYASNIV